MFSLNHTVPTIVEQLWRTESTFVRNAVLAVAGSLALWLCSKIQVPFYPVPVTMGTFAVLVIGMAYGWRLAAVTVMLHLLQGAVGLPVFSGTPERGLGLPYMMGPTGGYLLGFLLAVIVVGWLAERGWNRSFATTALAMLLGNIVIYVPGLIWLGTVVGWDKPVLDWGLIPFIPGDTLKLLLAAVTLPILWRRSAK